MATALKLRSDIKKLKAAINSKATPKSFVPKLKAQLEKAEGELQSMKSSSSKGRPRKDTSKGTEKTLSALQKLVQKNKKYAKYRGAGVDLKKDAGEPAFKTGRRVSKGLKANQFGTAKENKGNIYYEYRPNRLDVKQPPKRYPKLEEGGMMAKGGEIQPYIMWVSKDGNKREMYGEYKSHRAAKMAMDKAWKSGLDFMEIGVKPKSMYEKEGFWAKGGYMAKGGGIYSSDDVWVVKFQHQESGEFEEVTVRANNKKNAIAIAEDESGLSGDWQYYSADKEMASGGEMAEGGKTDVDYSGEYFSIREFVETHDGMDKVVAEKYKIPLNEVDDNLNGELGYDTEIIRNLIKGKGYKVLYDNKSELIIVKKKMASGGYMAHGGEMHRSVEQYAKGGAMEHGLKVGDEITNDMFWEKKVTVTNKRDGKTYMVHLETGERKELGK